MDIDAPYFTVAEMARTAGLKRGLADQWIHRGLIKPTRIERLSGRRHPLFSVRAIFKARLVVFLGEHFLIGPSDSAASVQVADMLAGEDWMYSAARNRKSSRPIDWSMAVTRIDGCWRWKLYLDKAPSEPFGPGVPHIVLQLSPIFFPVYDACEAMLTGHSAPEQPVARRARS